MDEPGQPAVDHADAEALLQRAGIARLQRRRAGIAIDVAEHPPALGELGDEHDVEPDALAERSQHLAHGGVEEGIGVVGGRHQQFGDDDREVLARVAIEGGHEAGSLRETRACPRSSGPRSSEGVTSAVRRGRPPP